MSGPFGHDSGWARDALAGDRGPASLAADPAEVERLAAGIRDTCTRTGADAYAAGFGHLAVIVEELAADGQVLVMSRAAADLLCRALAVVAATDRVLAERAAAEADPDAAGPGPDRACPGCVGRGTGPVCAVCGGPVPPYLRRGPGAPGEVRADCPDCAAGRQHTHTGGVR